MVLPKLRSFSLTKVQEHLLETLKDQSERVTFLLFLSLKERPEDLDEQESSSLAAQTQHHSGSTYKQAERSRSQSPNTCSAVYPNSREMISSSIKTKV